MGNLNYEQIISLLIKNIAFVNKKEAVTHISNWLNLSETSVYNKLNGRSHFTLEEVCLICQKANISFDSIIHGTSKRSAFVSFFADGLKYQPRSFEDFINNINGYYFKVKQLNNVHGYFLANELPLFHFLPFPHLMYLKMYIYNEINWKINGISNKYNTEEYIKNQDLKHSINILRDQFHSFPHTEIWNPYMLDNTISQFLYLKELMIIQHDDDIKNIKEQFTLLIDSLENLTNSGQKPANSRGRINSCDIFITDLNIGSEVILVISDEVNLIFQQVDVPNYMSSTDERMVANQLRFFNNIKRISTHITHTGGKDKHLFFTRMRAQLNRI